MSARAVYLLVSVVMNKVRGFVNQRCIERYLGRGMDDDLPRLHDPDVGPGLEILRFDRILYRAILGSYDYYPGARLLRRYWGLFMH